MSEELNTDEAIRRLIDLENASDCHSPATRQQQEEGDEAYDYLVSRDRLAARVEELEATLEKVHRLTGRDMQPEDREAGFGAPADRFLAVHGWEPVAVERLRLIRGLSL
tara:strand:- start:106 stop:432 length:327 start_codon:yes stop_codon:yes gene_type:complete